MASLVNNQLFRAWIVEIEIASRIKTKIGISSRNRIRNDWIKTIKNNTYGFEKYNRIRNYTIKTITKDKNGFEKYNRIGTFGLRLKNTKLLAITTMMDIFCGALYFKFHSKLHLELHLFYIYARLDTPLFYICMIFDTHQFCIYTG